MTHHEQLYFGGEIVTVDDTHPTAEALAVRNGRIAAVGSRTVCRAVLGSAPELIDLQGSVMLPGFIDTHLHPPLMIFFDLYTDLSKVTSLADLSAFIAEEAKRGTGNEWIMGLQFDDRVIKQTGRPDRHDLDSACTGRPVVIVLRDGHSIIANTAAIETAGITSQTPDPAGGCVERESNGYPAGLFSETAVSLILDKMPFPELDAIMQAGTAVFDRIVKQGITSIGMVLQTDDEGVAGTQGVYDIPLLEMLLDRIPINLYALLAAKDIGQIVALRNSRFHRSETACDRRIGGFKFWADGTFSSCTACMQQPFTDFRERAGFLIHTPDQMYSRMVEAHLAGLQIAVHSIGDKSTRVCVDLFDQLLREHPDNAHRHRLEHASQLDARLIQDIARLKLVISTQPMFIHSEKEWLPRRLGPDRTPWTYAFHSLLEAGIMVAGASDAPIEELNVLQAIGCCVTRDGFEPRQRISAGEALRLFTINAAYAQFEETVKGSLTAGKRADMVILDRNPLTVPPDEIQNIQVRRTICGGVSLYTR